MKSFELVNGDSLNVLKTIPDNSVDSIVCDPPYGLSFMSKKWDYDVPSVDMWRECLRVMKPGGHLLAFAGTRTQHRMAVNIEDAGFEIRDLTAWVYGSGFPKSLDISKAINKAAGAEREVVGLKVGIDGRTVRSRVNTACDEVKDGFNTYSGLKYNEYEMAPATEAAKQWDGWGTALKPAFEPITVARKPLIGTVADNVLKYGTGGLNIDGCRVETEEDTRRNSTGGDNGLIGSSTFKIRERSVAEKEREEGRFPSNLIHDGSEEVVALFPNTKSGKMKQRIEGGDFTVYGTQYPRDVETIGDSGSAARFFYCAKTSKAEREAGLQGFAVKEWKDNGYRDNESTHLSPRAGAGRTTSLSNNHPTVKPLALMRYLCRLVTPPGGLVVDPFAGSGSTIAAAMQEGFDAIGIEREADYVEISRARIIHHGGTESEIIDLLNMIY